MSSPPTHSFRSLILSQTYSTPHFHQWSSHPPHSEQHRFHIIVLFPVSLTATHEHTVNSSNISLPAPIPILTRPPHHYAGWLLTALSVVVFQSPSSKHMLHRMPSSCLCAEASGGEKLVSYLALLRHTGQISFLLSLSSGV